jgi:hypothetical protein
MQDDDPDIFHFQFYIFNYRSGGHEGTRTPNFLLVREAVYQLTYVPKTTRFSKKYAHSRQKSELTSYENYRAAVKLKVRSIGRE